MRVERVAESEISAIKRQKKNVHRLYPGPEYFHACIHRQSMELVSHRGRVVRQSIAQGIGIKKRESILTRSEGGESEIQRLREVQSRDSIKAHP